ncbi:MAG: hypothetical protein ACMG6E_05745 [Candidatus Roizmanbacteria bacterium]
MATIINTPAQGSTDSGNGMGMVIGVILLIGLFFLFFVYGFPMMRNSMGRIGTTPQINVPDKIDINVNQPK